MGRLSALEPNVEVVLRGVEADQTVDRVGRGIGSVGVENDVPHAPRCQHLGPLGHAERYESFAAPRRAQERLPAEAFGERTPVDAGQAAGEVSADRLQ